MPPLHGTGQDPNGVTVELELSPAEQRELARMYEAACEPPHRPATSPNYDRYICERAQRADALGTTTFAAVVCAVAGLVGWHVLGGESPPKILAAAAPARTAPAPQKTPPVALKVANPFDPTEVFELPAGMPEADARDAVAELLLERARERVAQGLDRHGGGGPRSHAAAAPTPSDVVVTTVVPGRSALAATVGGTTALLE